jgi:hypothetical protein
MIDHHFREGPMFPPHPNSDRSGKKPEQKSEKPDEPVTMAEIFKMNFILGFYFVTVNIVSGFLPEVLNWMLFAWMLVGIVIVTNRLKGKQERHLAKSIQRFADGAKYVMMVVAWPVVLEKTP